MDSPKIAVVVPTIRPEQWEIFEFEWRHWFQQHRIRLIKVEDGDDPIVRVGCTCYEKNKLLQHGYFDLLYNKSDVVRNLGFLCIARYMPDVTHILTLDDDCLPCGDTIQDHLNALEGRVSTSWMSTSPQAYLRGFPYGVRDESPVMVSHGVWRVNADWDAPTQLVNGNKDVEDFYRGPVPKGALIPFCGMNVMFKREALPYMYYAPMGPGVTEDSRPWDRFGDIWLGVTLKKKMDELGWAMVTGYATVNHSRASNVWANLSKEAAPMEWNERFWQEGDDTPHPYFQMYAEKRERWAKLMHSWIGGK